VSDIVVANPQGAAAAQPGRVAVCRPDPLYHGVLLAISSAILCLALVLSVRDRTQVLLPWLNIPLPELCLMRRVTGLGCPGCGMTRCFISLAHGDWANAWSYNPAGLFLFIVIAFQIPFRGMQLWRIGRGWGELRTGIVSQLTIGLFASALLGQWLLRLLGAPL
jgi:uncharacterized protein DUF2752